MAHCSSTLNMIPLIILSLMSFSVISQPQLNSLEQESVYKVLESINSDYPWRSLFPDDLCISAPHGVVCDYFLDNNTPHITELNFGYVSDYSPNPPCNYNSTLDTTLFSPLTHLRKLFFYKCFTETKQVPFPDFSGNGFESLEELVFIENPSLVGSLNGKISGLKSLRRFVLSGNSVSGVILSQVFDLLGNLEQLSLSRNKFKGVLANDVFQNLKSLRILDLSENFFQGNLPDSVGNLSELIKVDFSYNGFSGNFPESLKELKKLEFMDFSFNQFGNFGVPLFLGEMTSLKEVYLSGNLLGGVIPEIWGNLEGIRGIGLSKVGLVGEIPKSMGVHLRNLCFLGLDGNKLEGRVPGEFGGLEFLSELNLGNNSLSGKVPFSPGFVSKLGGKLKLEGNLDLCVDQGLVSVKASGNLGRMKVCREMFVPKSALFYVSSCQRMLASFVLMFLGFLAFFSF